MGISTSVLTQEDIQKLKKETDLKVKDIKKIHKKFGALDKDDKGYVNINDLVKIPEIEQNPLRYHIAQYMSNNTEKEEAISFEAFIKIIDMFKNNKTEEQYKLMFALFDFDKDGKISSEDMLINFKLLLGNSLNEEQIVEIVNKTISEYSNDQDQKFINYDEFVKILNEA
jgi:serine/threonine-protein phosphatase 2B regulatory subunit